MVKNTNMFTEADIAVDTDIIDTGDSVSSFITGTEALEKLNSIEVGIPVVIKWGTAEDAPTRQALFAGKGEGSYGNIIYNFFDNSGISGIASTSEGFIKDGNVSFDFENNDATEVGILTDKLKQQSGTNESEELNEIGPLAAGLIGAAGGALVGSLATNALSQKDEGEEIEEGIATDIADDINGALDKTIKTASMPGKELVKSLGSESEELTEKDFYEIPADLQEIIDGLSTDIDDPMYDNGYEVPDELLNLFNNPPKNMRVKDWMKIEAPFEYQLDRIPADVTFEDLYNGLDGEFLTNIDSDPRNSILDTLFNIYNLSDDKEKANEVWAKLGFERYYNEAEESETKVSDVEDRLLDLAHVSSNKYTLDDLQLYVTDKGNFNIRTKADASNPIGKDIITVSYNSLIKDEDDEIELRELGYFNDYSNMLLSDEPLTEGVIPASNFDFAHEELSVIQAEIEKIAGLKSEDTSNELYTDLLEVLDKAVGVLTDYIAEQPIGTVVGDSEPISDEPVEDSWADEMGEGVPVDEEPEDGFEESEKVEGNALVEDNLMEEKNFNIFLAEVGYDGVLGTCRGVGKTPEEAKENAFKLFKQEYYDVLEDLMQREDYQDMDEINAVEDYYGINTFDMSSGASNEGGSTLKN